MLNGLGSSELFLRTPFASVNAIVLYHESVYNQLDMSGLMCHELDGYVVCGSGVYIGRSAFEQILVHHVIRVPYTWVTLVRPLITLSVDTYRVRASLLDVLKYPLNLYKVTATQPAQSRKSI